MNAPKNAKKIEIDGNTFYAIREKMGYKGSVCFSSFHQFSQKFGWNVYNEKGAFVAGGVTRNDVRYHNFVICEREFKATPKRFFEEYAKAEVKGKPFEYYE